MGRFLLATADIDGQTRYSVIPESGLPHMPQWTAVDADDVRENPWDFEEPTEDATPDVGPAELPNADDDEVPADDMPAGNASADTWRAYAQDHGVTDADTYTRDALRDHFLNNQPLPSEEN